MCGDELATDGRNQSYVAARASPAARSRARKASSVSSITVASQSAAATRMKNVYTIGVIEAEGAVRSRDDGTARCPNLKNCANAVPACLRSPVRRQQLAPRSSMSIRGTFGTAVSAAIFCLNCWAKLACILPAIRTLNFLPARASRVSAETSLMNHIVRGDSDTANRSYP